MSLLPPSPCRRSIAALCHILLGAFRPCHAVRTVGVSQVLAYLILTGGVQAGTGMAPEPHFDVVVLGASGGLDESRLSAYLVSAAGQEAYLALDAGTLYSGVQRWQERQGLRADPETTGAFIQQRIKGYALSHAHIDHIAGLVTYSTDDSSKPIYALAPTVDTLVNHVFNWKVWPNFADRGVKPLLGKYRYTEVEPGAPLSIPGTGLTLTAFPLSHGVGMTSTAFLLNYRDNYLLYFGDTGPDELETGGRIGAVWEAVAPLVRQGQLKAVFLEASYPNAQPDEHLYGHLTPRWLMEEMQSLALRVNPEAPAQALSRLSLVVTHIKPQRVGNAAAREVVSAEIQALNSLNLTVIVPEAGQSLSF
ncbi:MBL fold metallo-hydrolase [Marinimicrobium sp. ARAG 43.8]|uniref:MBL fold metallo-hydrolase n=1 Tax=Marinimicrobium sp. ARAG 43.8 TaxID=3418719 RepID=UPI003CF4A444